MERTGVDAEHEAADPDAQGGDEGALFDTETFTVEMGGQAATTEKFRLYGGAVEIPPPVGGWVKGKRYVLRVEVLCHKDGHTDEFDSKTQDVVGCRRDFGGKITGASVQS